MQLCEKNVLELAQFDRVLRAKPLKPVPGVEQKSPTLRDNKDRRAAIARVCAQNLHISLQCRNFTPCHLASTSSCMLATSPAIGCALCAGCLALAVTAKYARVSSQGGQADARTPTRTGTKTRRQSRRGCDLLSAAGSLPRLVSDIFWSTSPCARKPAWAASRKTQLGKPQGTG